MIELSGELLFFLTLIGLSAFCSLIMFLISCNLDRSEFKVSAVDVFEDNLDYCVFFKNAKNERKILRGKKDNWYIYPSGEKASFDLIDKAQAAERSYQWDQNALLKLNISN